MVLLSELIIGLVEQSIIQLKSSLNYIISGPFVSFNYWSGKAIYYPTKKQFELYNIYHIS